MNEVVAAVREQGREAHAIATFMEITTTCVVDLARRITVNAVAPREQ